MLTYMDWTYKAIDPKTHPNKLSDITKTWKYDLLRVWGIMHHNQQRQKNYKLKQHTDQTNACKANDHDELIKI